MKIATSKATRVALVAAILGLCAQSATAAVMYRMGFGNAQNNTTGTPTVDTSPVDVIESGGLLNGNHTTATVRGVAANGLLHNEVEQTRSASQFGANGRPWVQTRVVIDDLIFFDLADPSASGTIDIGIRSSYSASVDNTDFRGRFQTRIAFTNASSAQFGTTTIEGGSSLTGDLLLSANNVPLNTARLATFQAYLELQVDSAFTSANTGTAVSDILFPTFILPEGFGVTSATFPFSPVPEPATLVLLSSGLLVLGRRWARRARSG